MRQQKGKWSWEDTLMLLLALVPIGLAASVYGRLPAHMVSHWGIHGEANGYMNKATFLIVNSLLVLGVPLLMKAAQWVDPKRENYQKFSRAYAAIRWMLTAFLSLLFIASLIYNLGYPLHMQRLILLGIALIFMVIGKYMGEIRFNYFIGIRTPWTLADEKVWEKTHRLSGPLWMLLGLISACSAFLPGPIAVWVFFPFVALAVLVPIIYSYILYRKIHH